MNLHSVNQMLRAVQSSTEFTSVLFPMDSHINKKLFLTTVQNKLRTKMKEWQGEAPYHSGVCGQ
jgi:hypothetical protein